MANRTENVGVFTAYGFAREGGYVGTKAEFEEGLAKSANYATNAQASATAAANSATAASGSATAASGSASTAAGYAQDADEFAQAAAASADEAEGYAESIDPDQFAKIDGYYGTLKSGESDTADNLTPYSSDSGTSQNTPFILQGSGCANGEEQADTGSYCQLQRKNGNTVTVNQLVGQLATTKIVSGITFTNNNDGTMTISGTAEADIGNVSVGEALTATSVLFPRRSHNVLVSLNATLPTGVTYGISGYALNNTGTFIFNVANSTDWENSLAMVIASGTVINVKIQPIVIDLTLWFGSNDAIPTHLLNHPEDFFRYYQGDLSYNVGTLTDCNGRYLKTWGRNLFNKATAIDDKGIDASGELYNTFGRSSSTLFKISPNTKYYLKDVTNLTNGYSGAWYDKDENFISIIGIYDASSGNTASGIVTAPVNAIYLRVVTATASKDDCNVSLYYEGESGYDQTYPYEELANIDTGNEELLAFDYKTPDGVVHKNTGRIDLGTVDWHKSTTGPTSAVRIYYATNLIADAKYDETNLAIKCSKYSAASSSDIYQGRAKQVIAMFTSGMNKALWIQDDIDVTDEQFKTSLSGVYLEYELADASKTTEQGTPFPENVAIDDFGTMAFDCPNGVPQGNLIFYPVDYKAEIDTLHNITDGDMHKIALKGDLAEGEPETIEEVVDYINARIPAPPAEDGTYNLTVTVASGEATYSWVSAT